MTVAGAVVEQRPLGRSECVVSSVSLGTAALALPYGPPNGERRPPDGRAAERVIAAALDRGVTFVDTAPGYGGAEEIVGRATRGRDCVVATKVSPPAGGWDALGPAELERYVRSSLESSLRRLGRDRVDLLQAHNATRTALEDGALVAALVAARASGLAACIGSTVYEPDEAAAAVARSELSVVQLPYNALDRRPAAVLDQAAVRGTGVVARSVLLRGILTSAGRNVDGPFRPLAEATETFRTTVGASWEELPGAALAFVLGDRRVTSALIGPRDESELEGLLDGAARFAGCSPQSDPGLPEELLDPRRWPREDARA